MSILVRHQIFFYIKTKKAIKTFLDKEGNLSIDCNTRQYYELMSSKVWPSPTHLLSAEIRYVWAKRNCVHKVCAIFLLSLGLKHYPVLLPRQPASSS